MRLEDLQPELLQDELLPEGATLAGWSALVHNLGIAAPLRTFSCISEGHIRGNQRLEDPWTIFDKRYLPDATLEDHLRFALRHEEIDLLILKRTFDAVPMEHIGEIVTNTPTGALSRRIWFFYETLTGKILDLEDAPKVTAVDVLDPKSYFTGKSRISQRHRVRDNLLGTGAFCPVIRRTGKLEGLIEKDLSGKAKEIVGKTSAQLISRAASFLLLADSRASFEIEGERAPVNRLVRWGAPSSKRGKDRSTRQKSIICTAF